jgi:hypothetical protein
MISSLRSRGGGQLLVLSCLITTALASSLLGCGTQTEASSTIATTRTTIHPVEPQHLAVIGRYRLSVVEGKKIRLIAARPTKPGGPFENVTWSGDGKQLAWTDYEEGPQGFDSYLTMVDPRTGIRHRWAGVYGPFTPGTTGIVAAGYQGRFTQYLPDGRGEELAVKISPPPNPERTEPTYTQILGAIPGEGAWLIAAENSARLEMPADSYRVFRFDPERPDLIPLLSVRQGWSQPTRLDDDHLVWTDKDEVDSCRDADRVGGYRVQPPPLPDRTDHRSWRIDRVIAAEGVINVLARGTGQAQSDPPGFKGECVRGEGSFHWLTLHDGTWVDHGAGLIELDLADNGRVARIEGEVCGPPGTDGYPPACESAIEGDGEGEGDYELLRYGAGRLDFPDGSHLPLPTWARKLRFSPGTPITVDRTTGHGPAIDDTLTLDAGGLGSLRFGATPAEMQAGTESALRFEVDEHGCESVELADAGADSELGVRGSVVDGRLAALTETTLDSPVDETRAPLSELQPDVSAIKPRGPRTDRGIHAGDDVDRLFGAYGTPKETKSDPETEMTEYVFDSKGDTVTAEVDGGAVIRRLEISPEGEQPCGG